MTPSGFQKKWSAYSGKESSAYQEHFNDLADKRVLQLLRNLFHHPEALKPGQTTDRVTEDLAARIASVARSLQGRESVEYADARTRKELNFAQRKNLRIARFLNRLIFCFFAEDTGLLPDDLFSRILRKGKTDPDHLSEALERLFQVMATGGDFGADRIRHFNGHLFEEATVFSLLPAEIEVLIGASESDWSSVEPSIMGTLFERALDESQRAAPQPTDAQRAAIGAAAKELNELRENWLNPEGWTRVETLEFPATEGGPWDRYVDRNTVKPNRAGVRIGTARYPRLVPVDDEHAAKLKDRTLTKLYNARPPWLALAHQRLDTAVAAAYAWPPDLPDEEILTRLLALNLALAKSQTQTTPTRKKAVAQRGKGEGEML